MADKLGFGQYAERPITRVPVSYLRYMVNEFDQANPWQTAAVMELRRRGTVLPAIEISGHAIDRASMYPPIMKLWKSTANKNEGLHAWLCRHAILAGSLGLTETVGPTIDGGRDVVCYAFDIKWVIHVGNNFPVLMTLMPKKKCRTEDKQ